MTVPALKKPDLSIDGRVSVIPRRRRGITKLTEQLPFRGVFQLLPPTVGKAKLTGQRAVKVPCMAAEGFHLICVYILGETLIK